MELSRDEKLKIMKRLSWDYDIPAEDLLAVSEGRKVTAGDFDRKKLFVRSLERLPWHYIIMLWGTDAMTELYTDEVRSMLWPPARKDVYDVSFAILREETLPASGWDTPRMRGYRNTFLSNRWNRT
jgi:hypothetical protein